MAKYGHNPSPRLSANQLAEYLTATPLRRKSIVRDARFPKTAVVARYDVARQSIASFLADDMRKQTRFIEAIDALKTREAKIDATPWVKEDCRLSVEAVEKFQSLYGQGELRKIECRAVTGKQPKLIVSGVDVSVSLDVTTHKPIKGQNAVGGIVLVFSKSEPSNSVRLEKCRTSAVLAYLFAAQSLGHNGYPEPKLCYAFDVFSNGLVRAPSTFKQKLDYINLSCEEVALRWPIAVPPDDYDGPDYKV